MSKEAPKPHSAANAGIAESEQKSDGLQNVAVDLVTNVALKIRDDSRELLEKQLVSLRASAESTIREKPLQFVGMALGVGCCIGLLMRRR